MIYNLGQQTKKTARVQGRFVTALVRMCLRHGHQRRGAEIYASNNFYRYCATGGRPPVFGGSRC
jgi:hypothetical protein